MASSSITANIVSPLSLIECPESYIIGPKLAESLFGHIWNENLHIRQPLIKLSFLFEVLVQKNKSKWKEYLDMLPSYDEISIPVSWTSKELEWLAGTNIYNHISQRTHQWKSEWEELKKYVFDINWSLFSLATYNWASAIFLSRSFPARIIYNENKYACEKLGLSMLLPVIDSLNHAPETAVFWGTNDSSFLLSIGYPIAKDTEIFNNYGPKGNEELLMGYGFCLNTFKFDLVTVKLGIPNNKTIKESLIQNNIQLEDNHFTEFLSLDSPMSEKLLTIFTIVSKRDEELLYKNSSVLLTRSEALNGIIALKRALAQKLLNINEQESFLTKKEITELGHISKNRYVNATLYRQGQRLILEKSLDSCDAKTSKLIKNAQHKIDLSNIFTPEIEKILKQLLGIEEPNYSLLDDNDNAEMAIIIIIAAEFLKGDDSKYKEPLNIMWEVLEDVSILQELSNSYEQDVFNYIEENRRSMDTKSELLQLMAQRQWTPKVLAEAKRVVYRYGYWPSETSKNFLLLV